MVLLYDMLLQQNYLLSQISWTYFNTLLVISIWKYYRYMSAGLHTA